MSNAADSPDKALESQLYDQVIRARTHYEQAKATVQRLQVSGSETVNWRSAKSAARRQAIQVEQAAVREYSAALKALSSYVLGKDPPRP